MEMQHKVLLDLSASRGVGGADGASNCLAPAWRDQPLPSESLKCASYLQAHTAINLILGKKKSLSDKMLHPSLSD